MEEEEEKKIITLVTGGYKNIGERISRRLSDLGHTVVATYRSDEEKARTLSEELGIEIHKADMSRETDVSRLFKNLRSRDLLTGFLVNNVSSFPWGPLTETDPAEFRAAFESSVFATFYCTREAVIDMKKLGGGSIVNIGMAGTSEPKGYLKVAAHAAAKTAIDVISRSYSLELASDNIDVNVVSPGIVDRPDRDDQWREKMRRYSSTGKLVPQDEIARAVVDLLVFKSGTTGEVIEVE